MNTKLCPYLSFDGRCETALKFYEQCLDGTIEVLMPYQDSPMEDQVPPDWKSKVMHAELKIGDRILMGSDCPPDKYEPARGTSLMVSINDPHEAEKAFKSLAENGSVEMPIQETFWAERFGILTDQFGIPWMINCDKTT